MILFVRILQYHRTLGKTILGKETRVTRPKGITKANANGIPPITNGFYTVIKDRTSLYLIPVGENAAAVQFAVLGPLPSHTHHFSEK